MVFQSCLYCILRIGLFIFPFLLNFSMRIYELKNSSKYENFGNRFDYVIVGGGSAGCILAARLSENSDSSVLLLEAGGEGFDLLNIPALGILKQLSNLDWQHSTVPQKTSCFGLENNASKWPSGKILGGSTHLNYMIYLKGHKNDYKNWKDIKSGHWALDDIDYYFQKSQGCLRSVLGENDSCSKLEKASVLIRKPLYVTQFSDTVLQAAAELGYGIKNLNENSNTGFMKPMLNLDQFGKRWISDHYLQKVLKTRKNLKILTNSLVEKILLVNGYEANGVQFQKNGKVETVFANVEIIISAGTVGSSKLLMLSGIGPKQVLTEAKIRPKVDLPVGKNLQDHITTGMDLIILKEAVYSLTDLMLPSSVLEYFIYGTGPLTSGFVEALGVIHSDLVDPLEKSPDLQFMVLLAGVSSDKGFFIRNSMGISKKLWNDYFQSLVNESVASIVPVLLHPKSKGEITLDPNDPKGKPKIDPKYLSHEEDVRTLVKGIRIIQKMLKTDPMKNLGVKFNEKKFPGCEFLEYDSDEYWNCYVRQFTLTVYHPVGTCKMGKLNDEGVVDHRLRVHKTNKLRVIDASIMPTLPSANTNAAVVMIAEKGADLIKEDFFNRFSFCRLQDLFFSRKSLCSGHCS